jgi:hypothetical protein
MTPSFASAPPSAQADASRTNEFADGIALRKPQRAFHQAGANSKSSLKRTAKSLSSLKRTFTISPFA